MLLWILVGLVVVIGIVVVAVMVVRVGAHAIKRAKPLSADVITALDKVKPKASLIHGELAFGEKSNPEVARGSGGLALFKDELVFIRLSGGEAMRVPLADLKDVTEIRAVSAMDGAEEIMDTAPDYLLKLTWPGNEAAFAVHDATGWISAIAGARM